MVRPARKTVLVWRVRESINDVSGAQYPDTPRYPFQHTSGTRFSKQARQKKKRKKRKDEVLRLMKG